MNSDLERQESCPNEEELAAYLGGLVSASRQQAIDAHIECCDPCLQSLIAAARRWQHESELELEVPALVQARVAISPQRPAPPAASEESSSPRRRRRLSRLPLPPRSWWIGGALAASMVLVAFPLWQALLVPGVHERATRSLELSSDVRIGAARVDVLAAPHPRASVVATLHRGDLVRLGGQDRDWYRVELADGKQGWIPVEALR